MTIKKPDYSEHAEAPGASSIKELEMMKVEIVSELTGAGIKFPIKSREELMKIFPKPTPMGCMYKGKIMTMHDLIMRLNNSDFPIQSAGDVATLLTTRCFI
ncbi:MAG: MTH865 family protein [Candidatus Doudnabacteria bacterium]